MVESKISPAAKVKSGDGLPPELDGGLPLVGHALEFYRNPVALLRRGREQFGDVFCLRLAGKRVAVFTGPKANAAFFKAPEDQLSAKDAYRFTVPIFGKGIVYDATPEVMSEQMEFIIPALQEERLQAYARFMAEEAEQYFAQWGEEGQADLLVAANELTVFIASRCLIGHEFRADLTTIFARLYHDMEGGINLLAFLNPYLPLPSFWRRDRARRRMGELISEIVAKRRASGAPGQDFLQTFMDSRYSNGRGLSDDEMTGLLLALIFAGQHTSSVLATWTGLLLLQNPEFLPPILRELESVFGDGAEMSLPKLRSLVRLERAMKEAERLRPPFVVLARKVLRDFEYNGYRVPAGDLAMVSPAISHCISEYFGDPDRYDPDRFAPGREEDRKDFYAMITFGGGRHRCVGSVFAHQQIKVIWSILLRRFELELVNQHYPPDYSTFVAGPRSPCLIRYRRKPSRGMVVPAGVSPVVQKLCPHG